MSKISWWETVFSDSISWRERDAINSAHDGLSAVRANDDLQDYKINQAFEELKKHQKEILRLQAILKCVVDALEQTPNFDGSALGYRIEAALEELNPKPPEPRPTAGAGGGPYRGGGPEGGPAPPPVKLVGCVRCLGNFPENTLNITERGLLCDPCFHAGD